MMASHEQERLTARAAAAALTKHGHIKEHVQGLAKQHEKLMAKADSESALVPPLKMS